LSDGGKSVLGLIHVQIHKIQVSVMQKLPTFLPKDPDDLSRVIDGNPIFNTDQCSKIEWYIKLDGTACAIFDGKPYKRYDARIFKVKRGKKITLTIEEVNANLPSGAIPCQLPDEQSGHFPHWIPVSYDDPQDKYILDGFTKLDNKADGTYECIGAKINGNPHGILSHYWIKHDSVYWGKIQTDNYYQFFHNLFDDFSSDDFGYEGLVGYLDNEPVCKIRCKDFGCRKEKWLKPFYGEMP
jgi:hypothetical protein